MNKEQIEAMKLIESGIDFVLFTPLKNGVQRTLHCSNAFLMDIDVIVKSGLFDTKEKEQM